MKTWKYTVLFLILIIGLFFYFKGFVSAELEIISPKKDAYEFTDIIEFKITIINYSLSSKKIMPEKNICNILTAVRNKTEPNVGYSNNRLIASLLTPSFQPSPKECGGDREDLFLPLKPFQAYTDSFSLQLVPVDYEMNSSHLGVKVGQNSVYLQSNWDTDVFFISADSLDINVANNGIDVEDNMGYMFFVHGSNLSDIKSLVRGYGGAVVGEWSLGLDSALVYFPVFDESLLEDLRQNLIKMQPIYDYDDYYDYDASESVLIIPFDEAKRDNGFYQTYGSNCFDYGYISCPAM